LSCAGLLTLTILFILAIAAPISHMIKADEDTGKIPVLAIHWQERLGRPRCHDDEIMFRKNKIRALMLEEIGPENKLY
jgi:hypothetical protein